MCTATESMSISTTAIAISVTDVIVTLLLGVLAGIILVIIRPNDSCYFATGETRVFSSVKGGVKRAECHDGAKKKQERIQRMTNVLPQLLTSFVTTPRGFYIRPQVCVLESCQQS
jgi:hypothetical protein